MNIFKTFLDDDRMRFVSVFIACAILLGVGFVLQYVVGLVPCPLCIIQRVFFALAGIIALVAAWRVSDEQGVKIYSTLMTLMAFFGGATALRQVWLQYTPKSLLGTSCAPWLGSILDTIESVFGADGDCAERGWTLIGLSIPEWSLIAFVGLIVVGLVPWWRAKIVKQ